MSLCVGGEGCETGEGGVEWWMVGRSRAETTNLLPPSLSPYPAISHRVEALRGRAASLSRSASWLSRISGGRPLERRLVTCSKCEVEY